VVEKVTGQLTLPFASIGFVIWVCSTQLPLLVFCHVWNMTFAVGRSERAGREVVVNVIFDPCATVLVELLAGEIDVTKIGMGNVVGQLNSGKVKMLAIQGSKRSRIVPAVPTMDEVGLGAYPLRVWWGLVMHAGSPDAAVRRVGAEVAKLYREPKMAEYLESQFVEVAVGSPEEFGAFLRSEIAKWGKVIKEAGIKAN